MWALEHLYIYKLYTKTVPKSAPPILLCWSTTPEAHTEVEPSQQHEILLPCQRWQQRGSLTKQCLKWKLILSKGVELNTSMRKMLHPLTFIDIFSVCMETRLDVSTVRGEWWGSAVTRAIVVCLHWCRYLQAWHAGSCSSLPEMLMVLTTLKKRVCNSGFCLSNSVTVIFVFIIVSMEINQFYFKQVLLSKQSTSYNFTFSRIEGLGFFCLCHFCSVLL